jgi:hypothetical protein
LGVFQRTVSEPWVIASYQGTLNLHFPSESSHYYEPINSPLTLHLSWDHEFSASATISLSVTASGGDHLSELNPIVTAAELWLDFLP